MPRKTETDRFQVQARDAAGHMKRLLSGYEFEEIASITVEIERYTDDESDLVPETGASSVHQRPPLPDPQFDKRQQNAIEAFEESVGADALSSDARDAVVEEILSSPPGDRPQTLSEAIDRAGVSQPADGNETAEDESSSVSADSDGSQPSGGINRVGYDPDRGDIVPEKVEGTTYHEALTYLNAHGAMDTTEIDEKSATSSSVSGQLTRMYEAGVVDRDEDSIPYTYEITDAGREVLYEIGPHEDAFPRWFSTGTHYYTAASAIAQAERPLSSRDIVDVTGLDMDRHTAAATVSALRSRCVVKIASKSPNRYALTPYGESVMAELDAEVDDG